MYALKSATFRCLSRTDYESWFKHITGLQKQSETKRKEMHINEEHRITTVARGLGMSVRKKN